MGVLFMMRFLRWMFSGALLASLIIQPAYASLRVNPLIVYLKPDTQGSSAVIQLTNVTDIDLPFEVNVVKRTVVDGNEVDIPADDDFVIFPPQMIIKPGATQTLRAQWLPTSKLTKSESYYIYVTQVPVEVAPGISGIRVNYRFGISAHIVPAGVASNLEIVSIEPKTDKDGAPGFEMTVTNSGTEFVRLSEQSLSFTGGPKWDQKELKNAIGTAFLLPGQTGRYFLKHDGALPDAANGSLSKSGSR